MIDIDEIQDNLYDLLLLGTRSDVTDASTAIGQMFYSDQDIPIDKVVYPRIIYSILNNYGKESGTDSWSDETVFVNGKYYVERTRRKVVFLLVSVDGYGVKKDNTIRPYINRLNEYLSIIENWQDTLDALGYTITNIGSVDKRDLPIVTYEERLGFDFMLQVDEIITTYLNLIEEVTIESTIDDEVQEDLVITIQQVTQPAISPATGTFTTNKTVTITCATTDTDIYYTLDGLDPDEDSAKYTVPFVVSTTKIIKARAFKTDYLGSNTDTSIITIEIPV